VIQPLYCVKCPSMACDRDPGPKMSGPGGSVMRDRTNGRNSTVVSPFRSPLSTRRPEGCKGEVLDSKWAGFDAWERCGSAKGHCSEVLGIADGQPSGIDGCRDGRGRCWRCMGVYL